MNTRYVKSAEEIRDLLRRQHGAYELRIGLKLDGEATTVQERRFSVPPPLEPAERPLAAVGLSTFGASNCVGPFAGGAITVRCRYGELEGQYCITMPMNTDTAVIYGRELYAEPKKLAAVTVERAGSRASATVTRFGITTIALTAELSEPVPDGTSEVNNFYFKYTIRADGTGLDHDPLLVCVRTTSTVRNAMRGTGTIAFAESRHDPVSDIPVVRVLGAAWSEGDTHTFGRTLTSVPADAFLPYAFGKMDDLIALGSPQAAVVG